LASTGIRRFRWSRAHGLRIVGMVLVVLAVVWLAAALAGFAMWSVLLLVVVALAAVGCLLRLIVLPPLLLEVSSDGYRLHHVRGGGVEQARWAEVATVEGGGEIMSITLASGEVTVVPLSLLGDQGGAAEREVHDRLNAAYGYRRLGGR
jgi:hypothetical protein